MALLYNIPGVEVFAAGTWNGDTYTTEDLDNMVKAFEETSQTCRPYLKLGHNEEQKLIQEDGLPAAGWIGKLYRVGEKLVADLIDIPEKIYQLIENKAYRNVSSEIYWDIEMGDKTYNRMLSAVALLGCDMPAVSSLKDILGMYKLSASKIGAQKSYQLQNEALIINTSDLKTEKEAMDMPDSEIQQFEAEAKEFKEKFEAKSQEIEQLSKEKDSKIEELETKLAQFERAKAEAELELAVKDVLSLDGACEAMKPYVKELLGEEKKVYSIESKEHSKLDLLKSLIKHAYEASKLSRKEQTIEGESIPQGAKLDDEIKAYMQENDCSYADGYRVICKKYNLK